ncbi:MAG: cation transporter dimerization domain-containing protein, partial [Patescibacteria group bacterium]
CLVLLVTIFTNGYATSLSLKRLLRKKSISNLWSAFNRSAFIETKTTLVLDVMGTTASILGLVSLLLYVKTGDLRFDGLGAMGIGVTLAILVLFIIKGAKDLLVGQAALPETEERIIKTTELFPTVEKVLDLRTLHIGTGRLLVNMEVHLINKLTTDEIELLIDNIKNEIKKDVPQATDIQIELETPDI